jgi:hypothetical protein
VRTRSLTGSILSYTMGLQEAFLGNRGAQLADLGQGVLQAQFNLYALYTLSLWETSEWPIRRSDA